MNSQRFSPHDDLKSSLENNMSSVSMQTEKSRRDEYSFRREDEDFGKDDDDDENNIDLNECLEMVQDFIHMYQQTDEDVQQIRLMSSEYTEIKSVSNKREQHMSEVIREMTKRVQNAERKTSNLLSSAARSDRFRKVEEEKRDAERYWSQMEREAQTLEETREILKRKRNELKKKRREMDVLVTEEIPKLKNALSLYAHVTKIAWKYEQKAKIEGRVNTNSANGEVKVIDKKFPRTEEDRFRLCNSLWDLID